MKGKLNSNENPYELDFIELNGEKIIALTRKNADFIEAVVKNLDSNYKIDEDENNKKGSKYWFNKIRESKTKEEFKNNLINLIKVIDNINSTHLEASIHGRDKMTEIIFDELKCTDMKKLVQAIEVTLDSEINEKEKDTLKNKNSLFYKMLVTLNKCSKKINGGDVEYIKLTNKKGEPIYRNNISFASKFISYAKKHLSNDCSFSKYDNVVSKKLPLYEYMYLDEVKEKLSDSTYENDAKFESDLEKKPIKSFNTYIRYSRTIKNILSTLKKDGITITEEEFDHIVWYTSKGNL